MPDPPQTSIQKIGSIDGASKLLTLLNFKADVALLNKALNKASVLILDIYTEAGIAFPADHAADPHLYEIGDECTAAFYRLYVASTPDEKFDAREEVNMCKTAVRLHIGISEGSEDSSEIPEPKTFTSPGIFDIT